MDKVKFEKYLHDEADVTAEIRSAAFQLHDSVGQKYDKCYSYGVHLLRVATIVMDYGHEVIDQESDIMPVIFAAFFHDSIEDARLTYNDVMATAKQYMSAEQAYIAAEIVYALTNDKGRTRAERAGERYYAGIRETPYAPLVKLCDRLANMEYSFKCADDDHMAKVYQNEWPHFRSAITCDTEDKRFYLPEGMIKEIEDLFS